MNWNTISWRLLHDVETEIRTTNFINRTTSAFNANRNIVTHLVFNINVIK